MHLTQSLFHSGKLSTRSKGLLEIESRDALRMNRADGMRLAIADGDRVRLSNPRGEMTTTVKLVERVPTGTVWFPDHFAQEATKLFDLHDRPGHKSACVPDDIGLDRQGRLTR